MTLLVADLRAHVDVVLQLFLQGIQRVLRKEVAQRNEATIASEGTAQKGNDFREVEFDLMLRLWKGPEGWSGRKSGFKETLIDLILLY